MTDATEPAGVPTPEVAQSAGPAFAHHSEAEFARILDFYEVRWEYEPHQYPILWSLDGAVQESFAPDFYLPDLDLYVELTTLRQRLVRKKNRKLRRLRELYPDIRIKLFYERDFRALMLKYGKFAIADELSGTIGQVGIVHPLVEGTPPEEAPDGAPARDREPVRRPPAIPSHADTPVPVAAATLAAAGTTAGAEPVVRRPRRIHEATAR